MTKEPDDVFVHLLNLPDGTSETVSENSDGTYSIFINARLSTDRQLRAYRHALKHIRSGDFDKIDVQAIELNAHQSKPDKVKRIPADRYIKEINRLKRERKRLQKQLEQEEERIRFLQQHYDLFDIAENQKLYGMDL